MDDPDGDLLGREVQREKFPQHVGGGFGAVVAEVSAAFLRVAEGDAAGFGGDEDDL